MLPIIIISICGAVLLIAIIIVLYITVFSKNRIKKQIKDIERRYSYLDALLIGQDSQYIHRLEIISHSNLLYVEKHETFSRRFKDVYDNDDKYAESLIRQLHALVDNKQYRNIKASIQDARKAVKILETNVNKLNDDLYEVIKLEEDSRQQILKYKEDYRVVKQTYYTNANDLELVSSSVNKVFNKLDAIFAEYDDHIDRAEYDEARSLLPTMSEVILALHKIFDELPNLCSLVMQVVPQKIEELNNQYLLYLKQDLPLYHLSILDAISKYKKEVNSIKDGIVDLKIIGLSKRCNNIIKEIDDLESLIAKEAEDKKYFLDNVETLYTKIRNLNESFLKITSIMPEVRKIYVIDDGQEDRIGQLKNKVDTLWSSKRMLDGFLNSATKQPFSMLKEKLVNLSSDYDSAYTAVKEFKIYLDSLKTSCEEAYNMISIYYYRAKEVEYLLRLIALPEFSANYTDSINETYRLICQVDLALKAKPINVSNVNELVESLKNHANPIFDELEEKYRDSSLAESAIVYANRDRNHQNDVNQELSVLEQNFYQGEFDNVYEDANAIYRRAHVEESGRARK